MRRRLSTRLAVTVLTVATVLTTGGIGRADAGKTGEARTATSRMDDMRADIGVAMNVVNQFWATRWPQFFTGRYSPPHIFGGFSRTGRPAPYCGNRRLAYGNAYYCPDGDFIAWDDDLMRKGYRSGDAWVYQVVAHEWGHAVQRRLNFLLVARAHELQADCLAGAALYGAAADGMLRFEAGDVDELAAAYRRLGDRTPWTKVSDHGTSAQRMANFNRGAGYGVPGCMPR
jgi:predicted metalloprotease